jgi:hypothetical protein
MLILYFCHPKKWRLVRVVEGARLESVYRGNSIKGSNPLVSAKSRCKSLQRHV